MYEIPAGIDFGAWIERNRLCGDYLPLIAVNQNVRRQELICELACKLFDSWAMRRVRLVKYLDDIPRFHAEQETYLSQIVMPHLSYIQLDESERAAIQLAIAGRKAHFLAEAIQSVNPDITEQSAPEVHPKVFISYSQDQDPPDHCDRVHTLANRLRHEGVDVNFDRFDQFPGQGWTQWMLNQLQNSDFVLCVCTSAYRERFENQTPSERGKGARFEGHVITTEIYEAASVNVKFVPILFNAESAAHIPSILKSATHYCLDQQYEALYALLTSQVMHKKEPLGSIRTIVPHDPAGQTGAAELQRSRRDGETNRREECRAEALHGDD